MASALKRIVNFDIYQETHSNNVFHKLHGRKDDIIVYDKCGRLVYHIPFPKSYIRYRFVEAAILSAYLDNPCGPCRRSLPSPSPAILGEEDSPEDLHDGIKEESPSEEEEGSGDLDEIDVKHDIVKNRTKGHHKRDNKTKLGRRQSGTSSQNEHMEKSS